MAAHMCLRLSNLLRSPTLCPPQTKAPTQGSAVHGWFSVHHRPGAQPRHLSPPSPTQRPSACHPASRDTPRIGVEGRSGSRPLPVSMWTHQLPTFFRSPRDLHQRQEQAWRDHQTHIQRRDSPEPLPLRPLPTERWSPRPL